MFAPRWRTNILETKKKKKQNKPQQQKADKKPKTKPIPPRNVQGACYTSCLSTAGSCELGRPCPPRAGTCGGAPNGALPPACETAVKAGPCLRRPLRPDWQHRGPQPAPNTAQSGPPWGGSGVFRSALLPTELLATENHAHHSSYENQLNQKLLKGFENMLRLGGPAGSRENAGQSRQRSALCVRSPEADGRPSVRALAAAGPGLSRRGTHPPGGR